MQDQASVLEGEHIPPLVFFLLFKFSGRFLTSPVPVTYPHLLPPLHLWFLPLAGPAASWAVVLYHVDGRERP